MKIEIRRLLNTRVLGVLVLLMSLIPVMPNAVQAQNTEVNRGSATHAMTFTQLQDKFYKTEIKKEISVNVHEMTVEQALRVIARKTGLRLSYRGDIMVDKIISIQKENITVSVALANVLDNTGLDYKISQDGYLLITEKEDLLSEILQETVTGTVFDAQTGEALPGVNIIVAGADQVTGSIIGTTTNIDGTYQIEVPEGLNTLVFTYVGYQRLVVSIDGRNEINVQLSSDDQLLGDVVVIGYGTQRRESVTGSVASVPMQDLRSSPVTGVDQAITGKIAGVQVNNVSGVPGGGPTIRIRGVGSIGAGSDPLYVVDGFPIPDSPNQRSNPLNSIPPDQIESVQILKDASATSIYGSRGANGVIIITTKSGTPTTQIQLNSSVSMQNVRKRGRVEVLNARQFAQFKKDRISNLIRFNEDREPVSDDIPEMYRNPDQYGEGTIWPDEILNDNALMHNQNLSVSGGNEYIRSVLSLNVMNQQGTLLGSDYQRYNFRVNVNANPVENLSLGLNVAPSLENQNLARTDGDGGRGGAVGSAYLVNPIESIRNEDGSYNPIISGPGLLGFANPVQQLDEIDHTLRTGRALINTFAEYEFIRGLSFRSTFNVDWGFQRREQYKPTTVGRAFNIYPPDIATGSYSSVETLNWLNENTINYQADLGVEHSLNALIGFTAQRQTQVSGNINARDFPDDEIRRFNAAPNIDGSTSGSEWSLVSTLGRIQYEYQNKYLFSGTLRLDGSSRFGVDNRWGLFPSGSIGWRISEENFMSDIQHIDNLLLRVGYGKSGNFNIGNFTHLGLVNTTPYALNSQEVSGRSITNLGNINLGWEEVDQLNIGLDLGLLQNRLNFTVDYYDKVTDNMLLNVETPFTSGFNASQVNRGEVTNRGIEFAINSLIVSNTTFNWNVDFNISHNSNKVTRLENRIISPAGTAQFITEEGHPIGQFYGFQVIGMFADWEEIENAPEHPGAIPGSFRHLDVNGDGVINPVEDFTRIGDPYPDFTWGLTNSLNYRNFDFNVTVTGSHGGETLQTGFEDFHNLDGVFNVHVESLERWRSADDPGDGLVPRDISRVIHRFNQSTWVRDNSNIWIRNVSLGHTFNAEQFGFLGSGNTLRLYLNVDNAWISNTNFQNPEEALNANNPLQPGQTRNLNHPISRIFTFGVNISL